MFLLGALSLTNPWVVFAIVVILAAFVGGFLFRTDEKIEDRRKRAIKVAVYLRENGLKHIPDFLEDYAVGDYSGMLTKVKSWAELMQDQDQLQAFFASFRKTQVEKMLASDSDRAMLLDKVKAWEAVEAAKKEEFLNKTKAEAVVKTLEKEATV